MPAEDIASGAAKKRRGDEPTPEGMLAIVAWHAILMRNPYTKPGDVANEAVKAAASFTARLRAEGWL